MESNASKDSLGSSALPEDVTKPSIATELNKVEDDFIPSSLSTVDGIETNNIPGSDSENCLQTKLPLSDNGTQTNGTSESGSKQPTSLSPGSMIKPSTVTEFEMAEDDPKSGCLSSVDRVIASELSDSGARDCSKIITASIENGYQTNNTPSSDTKREYLE